MSLTLARAQPSIAGVGASSKVMSEQRPESSIELTEEQLRARRGRSIAIALALGAFVAVIFAVTIVRLGSSALTTPETMRPVQTGK